MRGIWLPDDTKYSRNIPRGSYWKLDGQWYAVTPNGHLANISKHKITEHSDHTITVMPSIRVSSTHPTRGAIELWHGFLEHGVWRTC